MLAPQRRVAVSDGAIGDPGAMIYRIRSVD